MTHEQKIHQIFERVIEIFKLQDFTFKTMHRQIDEQGKGVLNLKKSYTLAHTNLKNKTITIDIYTPRHRKPKSVKSILNILAHEITHHQKPPYRQFFKSKWIIRRHYPAFYRIVKKNVKIMAEDKVLKNLID